MLVLGLVLLLVGVVLILLGFFTTEVNVLGVYPASPFRASGHP